MLFSFRSIIHNSKYIILKNKIFFEVFTPYSTYREDVKRKPAYCKHDNNCHHHLYHLKIEKGKINKGMKPKWFIGHNLLTVNIEYIMLECWILDITKHKLTHDQMTVSSDPLINYPKWCCQFFFIEFHYYQVFNNYIQHVSSQIHKCILKSLYLMMSIV